MYTRPRILDRSPRESYALGVAPHRCWLRRYSLSFSTFHNKPQKVYYETTDPQILEAAKFIPSFCMYTVLRTTSGFPTCKSENRSLHVLTLISFLGFYEEPRTGVLMAPVPQRCLAYFQRQCKVAAWTPRG